MPQVASLLSHLSKLVEGDVRCENNLRDLEVSCGILAHLMLSGRAFSSLRGRDHD